MGEDVLGAFAVWQCKARTRRKKERKRENLKFVIRYSFFLYISHRTHRVDKEAKPSCFSWLR
jgi:hypothetical protein